MKYDYFVAGRWRNHHAIREVVNELRTGGHTVYCFIENEYDGDDVKFGTHKNVNADEMMKSMENLNDWQTNPTFRKIYENDMSALRNSEKFIVVFPAGLSAHMELGAAFGMGKECFGIGNPEKVETLYLMFKQIFSSTKLFINYHEEDAA